MEGGLIPTLMGLAALYVYWRLAAPAIDPERWRFAADMSVPGLMLAALSVVTFWALLSALPIAALPALVIAIAFHEYGHVLAYRLAGHPDPVFRLVPFGGVAMSDKPIESQVENAFISLMGPGFSIALAVALNIAATWIGDPTLKFYAIVAAGLVAGLNLLQMAPFYPLDGGRAVKAMLTIFGNTVATGASVVLCVLLAALGVAIQSPFFILIALFGGVAAVAEARADETLRPMGFGEAVLVALAFAAIIAAHFAAAYPALSLLEARIEAAAPSESGGDAGRSGSEDDDFGAGR